MTLTRRGAWDSRSSWQARTPRALSERSVCSRSEVGYLHFYQPLGKAYKVIFLPSAAGTPLPDWVIVGPTAGWKGAGGILGAG